MFTLRALFSKLQNHKSFLVFLVIGLFFRFYNLDDRLYFIYDQGRDALQIERLISGDFTLVGPSTGINGLFLGPLWYYLGIPGYLIGKGNTCVLSGRYIFLAS